MHELDTALPVHPRTGLTALGLRRNGEPIWPILGASSEHDPEDEPDEDVDPEEDVDPDADPDDEEDPDGAAELGDAGKKALDAMKAKLKAAKAKLRETSAELEQARAGGETDADKVRREAEQAATARANARIVRSEVRAAAAGKLADPADALAFLDLAEFEVDDDGEVDPDEIAAAIDDLLTRKPHLAANGAPAPREKRFKGTGDGGPRGGSKKSIDDQIRDAEKAQDWPTARRLKLAKLTSQTKK